MPTASVQAASSRLVVERNQPGESAERAEHAGRSVALAAARRVDTAPRSEQTPATASSRGARSVEQRWAAAVRPAGLRRRRRALEARSFSARPTGSASGTAREAGAANARSGGRSPTASLRARGRRGGRSDVVADLVHGALAAISSFVGHVDAVEAGRAIGGDEIRMWISWRRPRGASRQLRASWCRGRSSRRRSTMRRPGDHRERVELEPIPPAQRLVGLDEVRPT